jgi:O-antigen ligase
MSLSGQIRILGAGLTTAGLALISYAPLRQRFFNLTTDRFELWQNAIEVAASAPWLGVGDGRYLEAARLVVETSQAVAHSPHHSVLYAAASYGIPVAFGLVVIYAALTWKAFQARHDRPALLAMTVAFIVHDMTNNLFFIPEVALSFWIAWAYLSVRTTLPDD